MTKNIFPIIPCLVKASSLVQCLTDAMQMRQCHVLSNKLISNTSVHKVYNPPGRGAEVWGRVGTMEEMETIDWDQLQIM